MTSGSEPTEPTGKTEPAEPLEVRFDERGLVPVVAQDARSGDVLMLAFADREAVMETLRTRRAHYHSRSRGALWRKGATSGNVQDVVEVRLDCDGDSLLYRVIQTGPACHTGERSCFHRDTSGRSLALAGVDAGGGTGTGAGVAVGADGGAGAAVGAERTAGPARVAGPSRLADALAMLERVVAQRLQALPEGSYVTAMHGRGLGYVAQKVIEEAGESAVAALEHKDAELTSEAADLLFHLTVLLQERGVPLDRVAEELSSRHASSPERT